MVCDDEVEVFVTLGDTGQCHIVDISMGDDIVFVEGGVTIVADVVVGDNGGFTSIGV